MSDTPRSFSPKEQYEFVCKGEFDRINSAVRDGAKILERHTEAITEMGKKVFNGHGDAILALSKKLDEEIADNLRNHEEIKRALSGVMKFVAASLITIFVALLGILGSVWVLSLQTNNSMGRIEHTLDVNVEVPSAETGSSGTGQSSP